jgi:cytochrome c-type biogenesis protein CcmH/NrfG
VKQRGRILLARIYARDPDWVGQAEELLQSVLEDEPGNTDVHFYLGLIYEHQGHVERAVSAFRKVLELEPQSADARARVAVLMQAQATPEAGAAPSVSP